MYQRIGEAAYKKDLGNTLALCEACGHPEKQVKTIHVAGTNGKGTTTHLIAAGLQASGYKTGVYTSPHYKDYRERIKINGLYISPGYVARFIERFKEPITRIQPSFFEMSFVLALCYFRDQKVDVAVIETGLGGRLDSTNVIRPLLSVITNISFDHMAMLGNTLQAIAGEKAGIIKERVPVVIGEDQPEVLNVFQSKATEMNSQLFLAPHRVQVRSKDHHLERGFSIDVDGSEWLSETTLDILGPHQRKNLITAAMSLFLINAFFPLNLPAIRQFLPQFSKKTKYMGRWQILDHKPTVIADSAHNEGGLKDVLRTLLEWPHEHLHIVAGFVNDKDLADILALFPVTASYYFAKANIPRGLDAHELCKTAKQYELHGRPYSSVRKALAAAKKKASERDLIFVGGSIFVVAEVI